MSNEISRNLEIISVGARFILTPPMAKPENLQEWVNRKLAETGYSHAKVADRAKRLGHQLSAGYVNNLAQGDADNPSAKLMKAIAAGFGVPVEEVIAVVFGKALTEDRGFRGSVFAAMWRAYEELSPEAQREKKPLIDVLMREIQREL
jgi:transcriptional regulator with XRE-family HTH domain